MTCVFTVCTAQQYPFAQQLGNSLPVGVLFKIGLVKGNLKAENTVAVEEIVIPDFDQMQARYNDDALVAACKPFFAHYFLSQPGVEQVIYFDVTTQLFGDLQLITTQLATADIILTPQLRWPMGKVTYGDEKQFLNTGLYNAGFVALQKSQNTLAFLEWWQARLTDRAFFDLCHGMYHDQLWLNFVPVYFEKVKVVKNEGWNVGLHNLHERVIGTKGENWWVNNQTPLLFFNFRECLYQSKNGTDILQKSGTNQLVNSYLKSIKLDKSSAPVFSLYQQLNPVVAAWKRWLKQKLLYIIEQINYFPVYH
ncbi:MAG: hypothetical protein EAZ14_10740 [Runella slithyformis]|nr:MAG: hypothetical protein EAZ14_10740 [Runella slithyformis]